MMKDGDCRLPSSIPMSPSQYHHIPAAMIVPGRWSQLMHLGIISTTVLLTSRRANLRVGNLGHRTPFQWNLITILFLTMMTLSPTVGSIRPDSEFTIFLHSTRQFSRAFIQVDNELKYLVDGVAVHMNEKFVAVDVLPALAEHCSQKLEALPSFSLPSKPCPKLKGSLSQSTALDLRDCDHNQGGKLEPLACLGLLAQFEDDDDDEANLSSQSVPYKRECPLKVCVKDEPRGTTDCVALVIKEILQSACVPAELKKDLVFAGDPKKKPLNSEKHRFHYTVIDETYSMYDNHPSMLHDVHQNFDFQEELYCPPPPIGIECAATAGGRGIGKINEEFDDEEGDHHSCWDIGSDGVPRPQPDCRGQLPWLAAKVSMKSA